MLRQDAQEFLKLLLTYMEENLHRNGVEERLQNLIQVRMLDVSSGFM
jgi:hypothetical protein